MKPERDAARAMAVRFAEVAGEPKQAFEIAVDAIEQARRDAAEDMRERAARVSDGGCECGCQPTGISARIRALPVTRFGETP